MTQDLSFGGSCFKIYILNLVYLSEHFGLPEVATFWESVVKMNNWHQHRISKLIVQKLFLALFQEKRLKDRVLHSKQIQMIQENLQRYKYVKIFLKKIALIIHDPIVNEYQIKIDLNTSNKNLKS